MRYVCSVCGYIYDEAREKQAFSELPDSWRCPVCKAAKTVFVPEKKADEPKKTAAVLVSPVPAAGPVSEEEGMEKLSVGELSALCSNPVSYTHLDVYKRQAVACMIVIGLVLKFTNLRLYTQAVGINENSSRLNGLNPVFIKILSLSLIHI